MIKKKPNKVIELRAAATEALQGTALYAGRVMVVYRLIERRSIPATYNRI